MAIDRRSRITTTLILVEAVGRALGLEIARDHVGNLYLTLPGTDRAAKKIVLGSHLDSVRSGGNYDGGAGVLAGLAAVAGLKAAGFRPARDITVMAIRSEQAGAWFPFSYVGSRGALTFTPRLTMGKDATVMGMTLFNVAPGDLASIHAALGAAIAAGVLRPVVGRRFPLAEAARAHAEVLSPGAHGKFVLVP